MTRDGISGSAALRHFLIATFMVLSAMSSSGRAAEAAQDSGNPVDVVTPVRHVPDPGVITTNQTITPAGIQSVFESRVYGITFGASSHDVYAITNAKSGALIYKLDWQSNKVLEKFGFDQTVSGLQGLAYDAATGLVLATVVGHKNVVLTISRDGGPQRIALGTNEIAQVAVSPGDAHARRYAVAALTFDDQAAILDLDSGDVLSKVRTGIAPFGTVIDAANATAWVSNWGGRFPRADDLMAATGPVVGADKVVVDARGVVASGTVSRIDLKTGKVIAQIEVGLHPTSLALDNARNHLYVTNSNSDTVSVIDTQKNSVVETLSLQPFAHDVAGIAPESLVLSRDGRHLYVACAGINAIAVLTIKGDQLTVDGLIPTGWYPDSIALSPDGKYLGVATLLGVGSGWKNAPASECPGGRPSPACRYVHSYRGTIHVIPVPDTAGLRRFSIAVAENNRLQLKGANESGERPETAAREMPVPMRAGDPSPIKHIIYIIKENRSYDQVFGDLGKGNGDPALEEYSEDVTPNQRKLARDFVLLDNFYATGGNSGDGHQWVTQGTETDYAYLPGYGGRSYPYEGDDPMASAHGGFIWNRVIDAGKTFIDFGEYAGDAGFASKGIVQPQPKEDRNQYLQDFANGSTFEDTFCCWTAPIASLNPYLVKNYPAWGLQGAPDVARARIFGNYLKRWETGGGDMPNLVMVQLPWDHTAGTMPGFSTPKACIADNDYALGMIVDAVSHSKFWASTLILVVEDDAQAGVDHVDGHRTVALAISPYIKRGAIDSTFYAQPSMLKTIELILGLKNLSLFDLIANDMRASFQDAPNLTPYTAVRPQYSIYDTTPPLKDLTGQKHADAAATLRMNFTVPDAAPTAKLNRILWRDAKGTNTPYPKARNALFAPPSNDLDDEEELHAH